ncbi:tyrosine-protein phosphatase [Alkalicoccobacillus plakortidis]|uniref:Tyrosine-protein phosphatase n=1 Tax=Alkalicoccobacillus plakortidis TaxID=444060 RepID=A0ABT0XJ34_9BACI|nr:CpsB/CapC family capsule biosynthesis tyrosine phosphatase [Alkalicoccobacillus plakortidis]MCM2675923.1 tyrosine protein phosphatase [Alkalicoccobacillus plakortidis]
MIDVHCHILPGLDDGSASLAHSVEMARTAVQEGITTIIATPHHANPYFDSTAEEMAAGVEAVIAALETEGIPLVVKPGQEIRLFGELVEHLALGRSVPLTGEGRYVLVEFPTNSVPAYSERLFYDLAVQGYIPVIAHPERNKVLQEKPDKLFEFVRNGALTQITTSSVTGHFGKTVKSFTDQLLEANLAHLLASDAHNLQARTFRMKQASDLIEEEFGTDLLYQFQENAELLVSNQNLIIYPPEPVRKKRKRFSFFG